MATTTLDTIRTKVRRITRSPSVSQITDAELDQYINTFVQYDFPETLRLFNLRTTFSFYTEPNRDTYSTTTAVTTDPLYNFKQKYLTIHEPVYIAGYRAFLSQSREQFYNIYPQTESIQSIGTTGDGVTTIFTGTLSAKPVLRNSVVFSSIDINGNGVTLIDNPTALVVTGDLIVPNAPLVSCGTINYVTGVWNVNFPVAPAAGATINTQTLPYVAARPLAVLFYDGTFTVRPVPDQPYKVSMEVYVRPTELLAAGQSPELEEWWQYISWGTAKKIFEDRMDRESIDAIMPSLKEQEVLILRRTLVQQGNERTATLYSEQAGFGSSSSGWGFGPY
jgi:hypothetical protein